MTQANTAKPSALTSKNAPKKQPSKGQRPQARRPAFSPVQSQMESKLSTLFNLSTQRARGQLADLRDIGDEGVGHINVHRNSKSKLGYLLSTAATHDFTLFNKRFTSIDNLTMYYRSHCTVDALATGSVGLTREFNRNRVKSYPGVKNMFVLVCLGYMEIFKRNPVLMEAMQANALPLDSYDVVDNGKTRKRHQASSTLVAAVQEAYQAVRDNREPDLKKFMFNDLARSLSTRATMEGKNFMEVVTSEFSPRAVRDLFNTKHADLAAKIREEEQKRRAEQKAARNAKREDDKPAAPVELGDANEIIKGEVGLEVIKDEPAAEGVLRTDVVKNLVAEQNAAHAQILANTAAPEVAAEAVEEVKTEAEAPVATAAPVTE